MIKNIIKVFLISMLPVIELRGGIPFGFALGLDTWVCVTAAILGNLLPVPFIIVFGPKVFKYLASFNNIIGRFFKWILALGEKKVAKMYKTLFWGIFTFVAIPLPGTGAWTGSLVAITLNLSLKRALPPIILGVIGAAAIMTTGSIIFEFFLGLF